MTTKRVFPLVLLGALVSAGIAFGQAHDSLLPEPVPAEYREIAARADAYFTALLQARRFNGTVLLHRGKWTILKKGYGMANFEWDNPNTPATKFRLGSLTQQFTAVAIMQLEEQGKLKVDDPIGMYLADYPKPAADQVTIHHLLTHTSGIPSYTDDPDYRKSMANHFTVREMIARFKDKPLEFPPGSQFKYSLSGYFLLGAIIDKLGRGSYDHYVLVNILEAARMDDSGPNHWRPVLKYRASGYEAGEPEMRNAPYLNLDQSYAAGSLYSTVEDLYMWDQALYRNVLVGKPTLERIFKPWVSVGGSGSYGYGWAISTVKGHRNLAGAGETNGFASYISRFPDDNAMFVYLRNVAGPLPPSTNADLAGILFGEKIEPPSERAAGTSSPNVFGEFIGTYVLAPEFSFTVTRQGPRLFLQAAGQPALELFQMADETRFFSRPPGPEIQFVKNSDGVVDRIVLHQDGKTFTGRKAR